MLHWRLALEFWILSFVNLTWVEHLFLFEFWKCCEFLFLDRFLVVICFRVLNLLVHISAWLQNRFKMVRKKVHVEMRSSNGVHHVFKMFLFCSRWWNFWRIYLRMINRTSHYLIRITEFETVPRGLQYTFLQRTYLLNKVEWTCFISIIHSNDFAIPVMAL